MKNNIIGLVGVGIKHGMWNADFDNHTKMYSDGKTIYASPYSLKYAIRNHFINNQNGKVLEWKSYKIEKGSMKPRTLQERFEFLTNNKVSKMNITEIIENLYNMQDVKNFGSTFAVKGVNLSLTGVVQISNGINIDLETEEQVSTILSPFKNSNEKSEDKNQTTNGETIFLDEAHYCYNISICPNNLIQDKTIVNVEYTEDDYKKLIEGIKYGPASLITNTKLGAETEYILMVHLKDGYVLSETVLNDKVICKRNGFKVDYDFSELIHYINSQKDIIESVDFYVNYNRVNYDFSLLQIIPNIIKY